MHLHNFILLSPTTKRPNRTQKAVITTFVFIEVFKIICLTVLQQTEYSTKLKTNFVFMVFSFHFMGLPMTVFQSSFQNLPFQECICHFLSNPCVVEQCKSTNKISPSCFAERTTLQLLCSYASHLSNLPCQAIFYLSRSFFLWPTGRHLTHHNVRPYLSPLHRM